MSSVWGYEIPRPVPPNLQLVGNMWPLEAKYVTLVKSRLRSFLLFIFPLNNSDVWNSETSKWLDNADNPVLYVSLGSLVRLSDDQLAALNAGFQQAAQQLV
jgi:hypothetical protein